ncbi:MAG: DUF3833 family protein [Pseudomonadota bacterium]
METLILIILGALLALGGFVLRRQLTSFPAQKPDDYDESHPTFSLKEHLNGDMVCEGVIYGPLGRVTSTFAADFKIAWEGDTGVMDEHFRYNDGSSQIRQWRISAGNGPRFRLEADDVPGTGRGVTSGNAVQMVYRIKLPEGSGGHVLSCMDWMYLTPEGTIMNRSQFRKFGIKVAELIATIRPKDAT